MKIICNSCNHEIPAADVNIQDKLAKCVKCNNLFDFSRQLKVIKPNNINKGKKQKTELGMPKNIHLRNDLSHLTIFIKWFSPTIIFLIFFCIMWDGFMGFWFYMAISKKLYPMALFGTIHGLVGLGLTYYVIAALFNKTIIFVDYDILTIKHKPFPFWGNKKVNAQDLKQLYVNQKISRNRHGASSSYEVHALTKSGKNIKLIALSNSEESLYIEQEIEKFLRIEDQPVKGEI